MNSTTLSVSQSCARMPGAPVSSPSRATSSASSRAPVHVQDVGEVDVGVRDLARQAGLAGDLERLAQRRGARLDVPLVAERRAEHVERAHLDVAVADRTRHPERVARRRGCPRRSATGACARGRAPPAARRARATGRPRAAAPARGEIVSTLSSWRLRLQSARDSRSSTDAARLGSDSSSTSSSVWRRKVSWRAASPVTSAALAARMSSSMRVSPGRLLGLGHALPERRARAPAATATRGTR